ncbi:hypothetical protein KUTeg_000733 [Tegillarca granosa]|uniref:G-protein coupled receptors family 1 profile domain-containing protein n=1 Tax=Tegillarca granosa TaxID=220873 RepID=A0ABQ9FZG2_TEGGR|nr:hypothetical protein KUTeg_000733 [Tegillarca granosa]
MPSSWRYRFCGSVVIGILGNIVVIIFYGWKQKKTPSKMFIVTLAVFDLVSCCLSYPLEITDMVDYFEFPSYIACKLLRFVNYFATMTSGLFLLVIAIDRFKRICHPLHTQINVKSARLIIISVMAFGVILSWPSIVFHSVVSVNVTMFGTNTGIIGQDCTSYSTGFYKKLLAIYHFVLLLFFVLTAASITILYILVVRKIYSSIKFRKRFQKTKYKSIETLSTFSKAIAKKEIDGNDNSPKTKQHENEQNLGTFKLVSVYRYTTNTHKTTQMDTKPNEQNEIKNIKTEFATSEVKLTVLKEKDKKEEQIYKIHVDPNQIKRSEKRFYKHVEFKSTAGKMNRSKFTMMAICITVAFVINFLPYCILSIWMKTTDGRAYHAFTKSELAAFEFGIRSWLINGSINPIIYGFFNTKYRKFVAKICCKIFKLFR